MSCSFSVGLLPPVVSKAAVTGKPQPALFKILSNACHAAKAATLFLNFGCLFRGTRVGVSVTYL